MVLGPLFETSPYDVKYELTKVPLFLHIAGAICCLGFSATFHLFKDHSLKMSESLARLDYAGISLMIAGSNVPPLYYSFYCPELHGIPHFEFKFYSVEEPLHKLASIRMLDSVCDIAMA